jgi:hypothetical protein
VAKLLEVLGKKAVGEKAVADAMRREATAAENFIVFVSYCGFLLEPRENYGWSKPELFIKGWPAVACGWG